jgi:hypothetical protein
MNQEQLIVERDALSELVGKLYRALLNYGWHKKNCSGSLKDGTCGCQYNTILGEAAALLAESTQPAPDQKGKS